MIEIRNKRESFHNSIRSAQRQAKKARIRKELSQNNERIRLMSNLGNIFSFFNEPPGGKQDFWKYAIFSNHIAYQQAYDVIDIACQNVKFILSEYQGNKDLKDQIRYYMIENLPFLIPPPEVQLYQLPKSFIELSIYLLKDPNFHFSQKEDFVKQLPYETINRCILNYFEDNWTEIKQNKCNDLCMIFLAEMINFKNIFSGIIYNSPSYESLLRKVVQQILSIIHMEIHVSENLEDSLKLLVFPEQYNIFNSDLREIKQYESVEDKTFYLMKNVVFLSNLILLSPYPNFDIKEMNSNLKSILKCVYRSILLNKEQKKYIFETEFCISVLISCTVDIYFNDSVQYLLTILNSDVKRTNDKKTQEDKKIQIENDFLAQNQQALESQWYCRDQNNKSFIYLSNKVKLLMICSVSREFQTLKFDHVEKWISYQLKKSQTESIFQLDQHDIIGCFFDILTSFLIHQSKSMFNSYNSHNQVLSNKRVEQFGITKVKIFKMFGTKLFNQSLNHENSKKYCNQFSRFLSAMMLDLQQVSSIATCIFNQRSTSYRSLEKSQDEVMCQIAGFLKHQIYRYGEQLLKKCYKYMNSKIKEKLIYQLFLANKLSEESCQYICTPNELKRIKKEILINNEDLYGIAESDEQARENIDFNEQSEVKVIDHKYFDNLTQSQYRRPESLQVVPFELYKRFSFEQTNQKVYEI